MALSIRTRACVFYLGGEDWEELARQQRQARMARRTRRARRVRLLK